MCLISYLVPICSPLTPSDVESQSFYPSTLAMVCIFLLERDGLLPIPCKTLALETTRKEGMRAAEICNAFQCFRYKCQLLDRFIAKNPIDLDFSEDDCPNGSSTTAYPRSTDTSRSSWNSAISGKCLTQERDSLNE